jgi:glucokinase
VFSLNYLIDKSEYSGGTSMSKERLTLGIDLGGTHIKVGVVKRTGEIVGHGVLRTEAALGVNGVVNNMVQAAHLAMQDAGITTAHLDGVGVGAPGTCDVPNGIVVRAVNLGWKNVPLVGLLSSAIGLPTHLDNDGNCAAMGEQWCGAAKGANHVLLFTVGTGVGGGFILDGRIYHGANGWASEVGHMPADADGPLCACGHYGCLETVASATAMGAYAKRAILAGEAPHMAEMAAQGVKIDARLVITAAQQGDGPALAVIEKVAGYLGYATAILVSALNPELVVFGGGGSNAGELLLTPIRAIVQAKAMPGPAQVVKIVVAELGNDAGLIGAASLVWR